MIFSQRSLLIFLIIFNNLFSTPSHANIVHHITQVIIWGHKLHSHTHSYIHAALYKAFNHLGYETLWLDNNDNVASLQIHNALFITEGQVDQKIPLQHDCYYVLHNCDPKKYQYLFDTGHAIHLQVYAHKFRAQHVIEVEPYILYDVSEKTLYMPWATDLLPYEIEENKNKILTISKEQAVYYIGTLWDGKFGNNEQINPFKKACKEKNIPFKSLKHVSFEENIIITQRALLAPAIQGAWQCKAGYIPCRIFKNISYGALGITNSKTVYNLFNNKIVYNEDTYQLFFDSLKHSETISHQELWELMDFVKDKHTYLNRIEHIFNFFDTLKNN